MTVSILPTSVTLANYSFTVDLDGVEFQLAFKFNERDDAWFLTLSDVNGNILRAGLKVVNGWTLLRLWVDATAPAGDMIAVNQGEVSEPATLKQLGEEVLLTYLDAEELAAVA